MREGNTRMTGCRISRHTLQWLWKHWAPDNFFAHGDPAQKGGGGPLLADPGAIMVELP
jgi:hypothetical protein